VSGAAYIAERVLRLVIIGCLLAGSIVVGMLAVGLVLL
jgi:hypothetical protein